MKNDRKNQKGGGMIEWAVIIGAVLILVLGVVSFAGPHIGAKLIISKAKGYASQGVTTTPSLTGFLGRPNDTDAITISTADLADLEAACVGAGKTAGSLTVTTKLTNGGTLAVCGA